MVQSICNLCKYIAIKSKWLTVPTHWKKHTTVIHLPKSSMTSNMLCNGSKASQLYSVQVCRGKAALTAAMCLGPMPQQPPMIEAPAANHSTANLLYAAGVMTFNESCSWPSHVAS